MACSEAAAKDLAGHVRGMADAVITVCRTGLAQRTRRDPVLTRAPSSSVAAVAAGSLMLPATIMSGLKFGRSAAPGWVSSWSPAAERHSARGRRGSPDAGGKPCPPASPSVNVHDSGKWVQQLQLLGDYAFTTWETFDAGSITARAQCDPDSIVDMGPKSNGR